MSLQTQITAFAQRAGTAAKELHNTFDAQTIQDTKSGTSISVTDASDCNIRLIKIYGNTTQSGSTTTSIASSKVITVTATQGSSTNSTTILLDAPLRGLGTYKDILTIYPFGYATVERYISASVDSASNIASNSSAYILSTPTTTTINTVNPIHTYLGSCTITNSLNVSMDVRYVCDEKTYIANKVAEIQALIAQSASA